jgi:exopolysaccharide biosynthesis polyprenyl glycosylphosphotransferase
MPIKRTYPRTQNVLLLIQFTGDAAMALGGLLSAYWLRFHGPLASFGNVSPPASLYSYLPLIAIGTVFFLASFAYLKIYDGRLLLRPYRAYILFAKAMAFWFALFLGTSLALKFEPAISRIFVAAACLTTYAFICLWRSIFNAVLTRSDYRDRLIQQVVILGWSHDADRLVNSINGDPRHPYNVCGIINTHHEPEFIRHPCPVLGNFEDMEKILTTELIDIVIVADLKLTPEQLAATVTLTERLYVQFKIVPSFFRIFLSNLHLQTISGVPVLGLDQLRLAQWGNSVIKRSVDIVGAVVGLLIGLPIMFILSMIIMRESPGSVIYRQVRTGRNGKPFTIYKLRSMRLDAEKNGPQWAVANDDRRLKIGEFMREWNLDELPQFWNVLIGDMSLVGPRPERPELIEKFEHEIPHYNPRHMVRPGVTGWAQVNGLRGNTSLVDRINYDLYYIENWTVSFDFLIMARTFVRSKNAY